MKNMIIFGLLGGILVGGSIAGTIFFMGGAAPQQVAEGAEGVEGSASDEPKPDPLYYDFHPDFTVNISDGARSRFLLLDLTAMAYEAEAIAALELHTPMIRGALLSLFSAQDASDIRSVEGKEKFRMTAIETVQKIMTDVYGEAAVEDLYFTKFVIQ